jgi:hypothetical protein
MMGGGRQKLLAKTVVAVLCRPIISRIAEKIVSLDSCHSYLRPVVAITICNRTLLGILQWRSTVVEYFCFEPLRCGFVLGVGV